MFCKCPPSWPQNSSLGSEYSSEGTFQIHLCGAFSPLAVVIVFIRVSVWSKSVSQTTAWSESKERYRIRIWRGDIWEETSAEERCKYILQWQICKLFKGQYGILVDLLRLSSDKVCWWPACTGSLTKSERSTLGIQWVVFLLYFSTNLVLRKSQVFGYNGLLRDLKNQGR